MKLKIKQPTSEGYIEVEEGGVFDAAYPDSKYRRGRVQGGAKSRPPSCAVARCASLRASRKEAMKKIVPLNAYGGDISPCLPSHYYKAGWHDFMPKDVPGGCKIPHICVLEIDDMEEEPKIVGYSRDNKGKVVSHHLKDDANTLNCGGGSTEQYVAEPKIIQKYGDRGTDNYPIRDMEHTIPANPMSDRGQFLCEPVKYRIRKLTPVETGRLMGMEDADIQKMKDAGISKSAMYKLHGNSIVVDVLYYIFREMFFPDESNKKKEPIQLNLFN